MIRRASAADLPEIMRIRGAVRENRQADPARATPAMIDWFLRGPGIWLWDEDGAIRGFATGDPRDGSVWALFVDPPFEGRGIGSALFDHVCRMLVGAGHKTLRLETEPDTRAEAFYRARGWTGDALNARGELMLSLTVSDSAVDD